MSNNDLSCRMAYHGIALNQDGTVDPCCQYTNVPEFERIHFSKFDQFHNHIRANMHNDAVAGIKHAGCSKCWQEESAGWTTLRQFAKNWYPDEPEYFSVDNPIYHVELRLGNFCNLKCVMCNPGSSSSIQVERQMNVDQFKSIDIYPYKPNIEEFWNTEEGVPFKIEQWLEFSDRLFKDLRRINITGGEPFIIPEVLKILDRLLPLKETLHLSFDTNLTQVSERLLQRLEPFKQLKIVVSLEGIGAMNDYLRYPSKWNEIKSNIDLITQRLPDAEISVNHTLQHASAYSLPALAEFCNGLGLGLHMTMVQGMDYMTLESVPPVDLVQFSEWVSTTNCLTSESKTFLQNISTNVKFNFELYRKFRSYINTLDSIRKNNYDTVFCPSTV